MTKAFLSPYDFKGPQRTEKSRGIVLSLCNVCGKLSFVQLVDRIKKRLSHIFERWEDKGN